MEIGWLKVDYDAGTIRGAVSALKEEYPGDEVLFDGKDTISVKAQLFGCSGIWFSILNEEEEDGWSTCIELREVNDKHWKGQWGALEGQKQDLEDFNGTFLYA